MRVLMTIPAMWAIPQRTRKFWKICTEKAGITKELTPIFHEPEMNLTKSLNTTKRQKNSWVIYGAV